MVRNRVVGVVLGGLLKVFVNKGDVYISNYDAIEELNSIKDSGIYVVIPNTGGTYGTLVVYNSFGGSGGIVQRYFHPTGINITRIKNSNSDDIWKDI